MLLLSVVQEQLFFIWPRFASEASLLTVINVNGLVPHTQCRFGASDRCASARRKHIELISLLCFDIFLEQFIAEMVPLLRNYYNQKRNPCCFSSGNRSPPMLRIAQNNTSIFGQRNFVKKTKRPKREKKT